MVKETTGLKTLEEDIDEYSNAVWLARLLILAIPIAGYQIYAGVINIMDFDSFLAYLMTANGGISLIICIIIAKWCREVTKHRRESTSLYRAEISQRLTSFIVIVCSILAALCIPVIVTLLINRGFMVDHFKALASQSNLWDYLYKGRTLEEVTDETLLYRDIYAGTCFLMLCYYLLAVSTSVKFITFNYGITSDIIFTTNWFMFAFSILTYWATSRIVNYVHNSKLSSLFPNWIIYGLLGLSATLGVVSFFIWCINSRKWRFGYFLFSMIFIILGLASIVLVGGSFACSRNVYNYYKTGDNNNKEFAYRMKLVPHTVIEDFGCPNKYIPIDDNCPSYLQTDRWEYGLPYHQTPRMCLNRACDGLLGQLYSQDLYLTAQVALLLVMFEFLVAIGCFYYICNIKYDYHDGNRKKDFIWFSLMMALLVIIGGIYLHRHGAFKGLTEESPIEEESDKITYIGPLTPLVFFQEHASLTFLDAITDLNQKRNRLYVTGRWDSDHQIYGLEGLGTSSSTYSELASTLIQSRSNLLFYNDEKNKRTVAIFYQSSIAAQNERSQTWILRRILSELYESGLKIYKPKTDAELKEDKFKAWIQSSLKTPARPVWLYSPTNLPESFNNQLEYRQRYTTYVWNQFNMFEINTVGGINSSFDDLKTAVEPDKPSVALYNLEEEYRITVCIFFYSTKVTDKALKEAFAQFENEMAEREIPVIRIDNKDNFTYDYINKAVTTIDK